MEKASSVPFSGLHFDRKRFAGDIARFKPKKEPGKSQEVVAEAKETPEVTGSRKEKRKRKAKGSEIVESFSVFNSSEPVPLDGGTDAVETDLSQQRKEVEKQIEKASILRKKYGIHISGHNVPAPLESFSELSSRDFARVYTQQKERKEAHERSRTSEHSRSGGAMEGLTVAEADLMVYIHPSRANKIRHAILRQLSSLLFTYDEVFEGVILAYEVNIRSKLAKTLPGLIPYFGVKLKANLLLFSPKPDMLLEGKVVKLGKESIHAIVLGFSSAAIMLEDIREEFKYKIKHGGGVFASLSHKRHVIKVGSMIRFLVKSLDEEILHISGSLMPSHTGCISWLSKHGSEDEPQTNRSLKRHRERDIKIEVQEQDSNLFNEGDRSVSSIRPHKSRKRTSAD